MDQELWRLRGVEYDLEQAQERIKELETIRSALAEDAVKALAERHLAETKLAEHMIIHQELEQANEQLAQGIREREDAMDKLRNTITRLKQGLERYQQHEYMSETYGFEITDNIPTADRGSRKGWRLGR